VQRNVRRISNTAIYYNIIQGRTLFCIMKTKGRVTFKNWVTIRTYLSIGVQSSVQKIQDQVELALAEYQRTPIAVVLVTAVVEHK
jgi:hypothetical protein